LQSRSPGAAATEHFAQLGGASGTAALYRAGLTPHDLSTLGRRMPFVFRRHPLSRRAAVDIGTEHLPIVGSIAPQSVAAAGNAASGWIKADTAPKFLAVLNYGALGGGTVTPTFEQATDASGTGAKALSAWGGVANAANNTSAELCNIADQLDQKNAFYWFRLKLSNVGGTGALVGAIIHGVEPRFRP
jgi:hypothetical protein